MTAIRWEQIKQHLIDYAQKFGKVVVFSIEDFAKTYGYNVEDLLNYIEELSDEEHNELLYWHETLLKSGKPIINLELEQYKVFDKLLNRTEKIYPQDDLKELKKKYPELSDKLERIETSSNRHTVKLIIETYLTVEYSNETFNLMLKEIHKILDIERTGDTTYENEHTAKIVDYLIFSFKSAKEIKDIFLNKKYYNINNIFTFRNSLTKTGNYEGEDLFNVLDYISSDAVKILKKNFNWLYDILSLLKQIIYQKEITSSVLTICEYDGKLIFPKVVKNPVLHDYASIPTPEDLHERITSQNISDEDKHKLLSLLTNLNKDHNILVMAYFLATLLINVVHPDVPYLILYGGAGAGKTKTADIFKFINIQSDRLTETQLRRSCHGYGCGFFLLDEPAYISNEVINMMKEMATNALYKKPYGRTGQLYLFKVGGIIASNNPYNIQTKTPDDLKGFLRRNLTVKIKDDDRIEGIGDIIKKLLKEHLKIKKVFIDWILSQNPEILKEHYSMITKSYIIDNYGIDINGEQEEAYKFIVFGLELLSKFFIDNGFNFIDKNRIKQILHRLKEDEKEFTKDIMNDDNIVEMIEQIIFNDLLKISAMKDREPETLVSPDTINKYSELLYNTNGYTMYFVETKKKKRICINQTGLIKLIKRLNSEYGTNYPEQINLSYFMEKLREKGINAEIAQKRISPNPRAKKPKALFIDVPYNFEVKDYEDILIVLKVLSDVFNGKIPKLEFRDACLSKDIPETRILEGLMALKAYGLVKEEEDYLVVNVRELNNILEEDSQEDEEIKSEEEIVKETIEELSNEYGEVLEFAIHERLKEKGYGISEKKLEEILKKLEKRGDIYKTPSGKWKIL